MQDKDFSIKDFVAKKEVESPWSLGGTLELHHITCHKKIIAYKLFNSLVSLIAVCMCCVEFRDFQFTSA